MSTASGESKDAPPRTPSTTFETHRRSAEAIAALAAATPRGRLAVVTDGPLMPAHWGLAFFADVLVRPAHVHPGWPLGGPSGGLLPVCGLLSAVAHGARPRYALVERGAGDDPASRALEALSSRTSSDFESLTESSATRTALHRTLLGDGNPLAATLTGLIERLGSLPSAQARTREARFLTAMAFDPRLGIARRQPPEHQPSAALTERLMHTYMIEGLALLGDGVAADEIERAAIALGFAHGPLWWMDQITLDTLDTMLHDELHRLAHRAGEHGSHPQPHHDHSAESGRAEHRHEHGHGHGGEHGHGHGHGHEHGHGGEHGRGHEHGHGHEHEHGHGRSHDHGQGRAEEHGQVAGHAHGHDHDHHHDHHHEVSSVRMPESAVYVLEKMAHGFGRRGRNAGGGFYESEPGFDDELWDGLAGFARGRRKVPPRDVGERLLLAIAVDALRQHELAGPPVYPSSAVLPSRPDFPGWNGNPLLWALWQDRQSLIDRLTGLERDYGVRFAAPDTWPASPFERNDS
ncbi:MAG: 3-hydroxyacyl-CoA dehydrogenase family protein [Burkholderiaceae bacterium]